MQPTSDSLHLGNYLGALVNWVGLQRAFDAYFFVADLHALTVPTDPEVLRRRTRVTAAQFIAGGVDPQTSAVFCQSHVGPHPELAWVLACQTAMGEMNRMTQFKDKAGKNTEQVSLGLYAYPSLMAADILLYHATMVPVGEDQKQHVELTRDIAAKFNHDYGVDFFPLTEPVIEGAATRVMSLRDGTKKMSKSDPSDASRINLTDDADAIAQKIKRAKTDPEPLPDSLDGLRDRPEARNLVNIYAALADSTAEVVVEEFAGKGFGAFKPALADLAVAALSPITTEMKRLMADPAEIDRILGEGADRADAIAQPILARTLDITGMIRSRRR